MGAIGNRAMALMATRQRPPKRYRRPKHGPNATNIVAISPYSGQFRTRLLLEGSPPCWRRPGESIVPDRSPAVSTGRVLGG